MEVKDNNINNDTPEVLMSPLLSEKFELLESKIQSMNEKYNKIYQFLEDNRQLYLSMLEMINKASNDNNKILNENRKLYTDALKKIEDTEKQNMNEIRPIINNMLTNNNAIENNILSPIFQSRVFNRYWRMNHINSASNRVNAILGLQYVPSFNASQLGEKILTKK